ncbi:hypothetical protein LR48_Vigan08g082900 [Vigna angularis]|uniref:Uncharacterized protein n=1 Tax=Phaseolus angularis TaxID=3914 RepID=A0A0L9V4W8_PHAAN|nr:hypothetical protein LR48_Vigan08g082900 [Vigna angularis]
MGEFGERSEEGERWNQKRHQKVKKEKPQLPLSGSLPLSGTQELTGDPLRGKMAAEGKKPTHALTAERMQFGQEFNYMGTQFYQSNFNHWWEPHSSMDQSQFWQAAGPFDRPSLQQWPPPQQWQQQPFLSGRLDRLDDTLQRFLKTSDATQKSIEESCKRMEMQLRYISQRLNDEVNTEVNPKEEGQAIFTESDKILDEKKIGGDEEKIERKEKEELSEKNKDEEKEKEVYLHPRMASSSGKRLKTMATKRKEKEPKQPHYSRFLSRKHEKHLKVVQDRRLLMERKVGMIPNFAPQFGEQLLRNDWGKLATYPAPANIAVVKEFYTNAKKMGDYPVENYLG